MLSEGSRPWLIHSNGFLPDGVQSSVERCPGEVVDGFRDDQWRVEQCERRSVDSSGRVDADDYAGSISYTIAEIREGQVGARDEPTRRMELRRKRTDTPTIVVGMDERDNEGEVIDQA